jgi:transcriptional regulator GlxA family with amidase domain
MDNPAFLLSKDQEQYIFFKNIIEEIIQEALMKIDGYQLLIKGSICKFFVFVSRYIQNKKSDIRYNNYESIESLKKVFDFTRENYNKKITILDMALLTNYSKQHFCRIFRAYTGKTFIEYLTLMRLENAEDLIIKTNLSITEISKITGFCTVNYFNRIFKKYKGKKPSYMRKISQK